jgi:hypothetical protein
MHAYYGVPVDWAHPLAGYDAYVNAVPCFKDVAHFILAAGGGADTKVLIGKRPISRSAAQPLMWAVASQFLWMSLTIAGLLPALLYAAANQARHSLL